jgi:hypothetical protein
MLKGLADNRNPTSLAARLRRRRFALFQGLLSRLAGQVRILDVGGTPVFWRVMGFDENRVSVTLLNEEPPTGDATGFVTLVGDARNMPQFRDREFDIVFSNSVIEHVGTLADQQAMASEVRRVDEAALAEVARIRLLSRREFARLFPDGQLYTERFLGLAKSFIVHHGWEHE